jgi:hypothetical protein
MWACAALLLALVPAGFSQASRPRSLLAPLPADPRAGAQLRSQLPGTARVYESEHFLIVHSVPTVRVLELADHLESVYRAWVRFAGELGLDLRRPVHKLNVLVFADFENFCEYRQRHGIADPAVLGLYDRGADLSIFFDLKTYPPLRELLDRPGEGVERRFDASGAEAARFRQTAEALYAKVIRHEAAHHVQFATGVFCAGAKPPAWLVEGLAQLFEVASPGRGGASILANPYRLSEFRALYAEPADLLTGLRRTVAEGAEAPSAHDYPLFWALVSYLQARRRAELGAYLRALADCGRSANAAGVHQPPSFEDYFGPINAGFAADVQDHLESLMR